ncbi:hypothetical protein CHS0354_001257 [Potamilus streckersoni]|uniref:Carbohydrate sulfotransferase n=1 Tax=Potamilus streckersoni TaxID=2493646 RepID=A0AAE0S3S5_9BIVA|nr:hypothetical protein CHS0354_001257 [Potamilus streckersoni]
MFPRKIIYWLRPISNKTICIITLILGFTPFLLLVSVGRTGYYQKPDAKVDLVLHRKVQNWATQPVTNATQNSFDTMEMRFVERRNHLQQQCQILRQYYHVQNSEMAVKEHLTIDKRHKLVYCAIEKIGCTFWKRIFQILIGFKNVSDPFHIQGIHAYEGYLTAKGMSFDTLYMLLRTSRKFMFVREPYERLLSGYVDKLFSPNAAYWNFIGKFVVSNFRTNPSPLSSECGHDLTFEEFARYFVYSQLTNERRDAHFVPNFEHCRPCEIDYDYIGKLETFEEDTLFLMHKFNISDKVQFKDFKSETERDAIVDAADYVFAMRAPIVKCMSFSEALFRCFRKLQIRGILSKNVQYPFPLNVERNININEFKEAMLDLHAISGPSEERLKNRQEAFIEAYSSLPLDLMENIRQAVFIDASLFGYEQFPSIIRNSEKVKETSFKYFSLPTFPKVENNLDLQNSSQAAFLYKETPMVGNVGSLQNIRVNA